jgi:hypothetical protein
MSFMKYTLLQISIINHQEGVWEQDVVPYEGIVFTTNTVLRKGTYQLSSGIVIGADGITLDLVSLFY